MGPADVPALDPSREKTRILAMNAGNLVLICRSNALFLAVSAGFALGLFLLASVIATGRTSADLQ